MGAECLKMSHDFAPAEEPESKKPPEGGLEIEWWRKFGGSGRIRGGIKVPISPRLEGRKYLHRLLTSFRGEMGNSLYETRG